MHASKNRNATNNNNNNTTNTTTTTNPYRTTDKQKKGGLKANLVGENENEYEDLEEDTPKNRRRIHRLLAAAVIILGILGLLDFSMSTAALALVKNINVTCPCNSTNTTTKTPLNYLYAYDTTQQIAGEDEETTPGFFFPVLYAHLGDASPSPPGWSHPTPTDFVAEDAGNYTVVISASPETVFIDGSLNGTQFWMGVVITPISTGQAALVPGSLCTLTIFGNGVSGGFSVQDVLNVVSVPILISVSVGDILQVYWGYLAQVPNLFVVLSPTSTTGMSFGSYNVTGLPNTASSASIVIAQVE